MKLVCINIERSKHLKEVTAFITAQNPDVLCLQEVCERDVPLFEAIMGNPGLYAPITLHQAEDELEPMGVLLVAKTELSFPTTHYYKGNGLRMLPIRLYKDAEDKIMVDTSTIQNVFVAATIEGFRIATTHFTWSPNGLSTPEQMVDVEPMLTALKAEVVHTGNLAFCGDFNAPRGRATFSRIAQEFTDAIPPVYTSSVDGTFHRAGELPYMVDGLFHTPGYKVSNVALHTGVSDHKAISATIEKA